MKNISIDSKIIYNIDFISEAVINSHSDKDWLVNGNLGKVLFLMTLAEYKSDNLYADQGITLLFEIIKRINSSKNSINASTSISRGLSGLGLVIYILRDAGCLEHSKDIDSLEKKIIEVLFNNTLSEIDSGDLDGLHSSIGCIFYFTKIINYHSELNNKLRIITERLFLKIEDSKNGSFIKNLRYEKNMINLGMAHGLCGIVISLLEIYKSDIESIKISSFLSRSIDFFLSYHNNLSSSNFSNQYAFPRGIFGDNTPIEYKVNAFSPLGWCYSDIMICLMLKKISIVLNDFTLSIKSDEIAIIDSLRKNFESTQIDSSFFCHGSSGYAWCLKKYYDLSEKKEFFDSHSHWLNITNDLLTSESKIKDIKINAFDILNGWNGVGLVMMSSAQKINLKWDSIFLLS